MLGVSEVDKDSLVDRFATRVVVIGPARAEDSYLDVGLIVHTAKATGCDAIHPGFGFLSENPLLAELCCEHDIAFIGPDAHCLKTLGDKVQAREMAAVLGLPVLQCGQVGDVETAVALASEIGYPVMLKASAGGGGRGIRTIDGEAALRKAFDIASAEAESSFGDGRLHLETFVPDARHVEVQIVGERSGTILVYGERDCSLQYNYQKVIEEAPCPVIDKDQRNRLHEDAATLLSSQNYVGLGTVEFLYDPASGRHFFLEVNPRIQVEHPVTEMVINRDLVADQIRVVSGESLQLSNAEIRPQGHAIECRINAQDPDNMLCPSPGLIEGWSAPAGPHVRLDSHCCAGYQVPPFYDAMLAKLIVWGPNRALALRRARRALDEFVVTGPDVKTNLALLRCLVEHPDVVGNRISTTWLNDFMRNP